MRLVSQLCGIVLVAVVAVSTIGAAAPAKHHLEVAGPRGVVWAAPLADGERFDLSYRHSQERVVWTHHYHVAADGALWLDGSTFGSYGAGMPLTAVRRGADGFRAAVGQLLPRISMLYSRKSELRLLHRGRVVPLLPWFDDYEPLDIRVR